LQGDGGLIADTVLGRAILAREVDARSDGDGTHRQRDSAHPTHGGRYHIGRRSAVGGCPAIGGRPAVGRRSAVTARSELLHLNDEVARCVVEAFGHLVFPHPEGGMVTVVYPIMFYPGD
jgi:hypothetical protein